MDSHARIVIVGGGIFGVSTALALAEAGHGHVEIVEKDHVGAGNTALAAGVLSLQTWNDDDAHLILETREKAKQLADWGQANDVAAAHGVWRETPSITIASEARAPLLASIRDRLRTMGSPGEILDASAATQRFKGVTFQPTEHVLASRGDGCLASGDLAVLIQQRAKSMGVRVRDGRSVERVVVDSGAARGLAFADGTGERADVVVVAGGVWTPSLLQRSGLHVPVIPYRCQLASIQASGGIPAIVHDTVLGFYARPESDDRFFAGDGTQLRPFDPDAYDRQADAAFQESIAHAVVGRFDAGAEAQYVNGWAGLCAGSPDRRPLAGPVPGVDGLHVLTGDNGFGVMRGLALGRVVACRIGDRPHPQAAATDPGRFGPHPPTDFPLAEGFSFHD